MKNTIHHKNICVAPPRLGRRSDIGLPVSLCASLALATVQMLFHPVGALAATQPVIVERGADYRVIQTPGGGRYTELGTSMHYLQDGQWLPSSDLIELLPTGGAI